MATDASPSRISFTQASHTFICLPCHSQKKKLIGGRVAMGFSTTAGETIFSLLGRGGVHTVAYGPSGKLTATGMISEPLHFSFC
jgi:hypothetical protein